VCYRELLKHRRLTHYPRCDHCYFISRNSDVLDKHDCKHHRTPAVTKKKKVNTKACPDCGIVPKTTQTLNKHIATVHKKLRPFKCDQCDYRATRKEYLAEHVNGVHKGNKVECKYCGYATANVYYIKKHEKNCERKAEKKQEIAPKHEEPLATSSSSLTSLPSKLFCL
jgi:hypothetical protein